MIDLSSRQPMFIIYGIKNCSTMKKAFLALAQRQLPYHFHDYKTSAISAEKIQAWLDQVGPEVLVNKKGTTWKKLSAEQQAAALADRQQLISTLQQYPSILKRPILEHPNGLLVGFDLAAYQQLTAQ
jgi:Spx/MgsR family transcriptional regulator